METASELLILGQKQLDDELQQMTKQMGILVDLLDSLPKYVCLLISEDASMTFDQGGRPRLRREGRSLLKPSDGLDGIHPRVEALALTLHASSIVTTIRAWSHHPLPLSLPFGLYLGPTIPHNLPPVP